MSAAPAQLSFPQKLRLAAADIKLAHSVFALPFAILGAFLARPVDAPWSRFAGQLAIVIACMVFARTWAMLINRLADIRIDAANPRTARRILASGKLSTRDGWLIALACAAAFIGCCSLFWIVFQNPWPTYLSIPVLIWIAFYSFTKRFTALCHVFLGGALAASPIAAAIAINPAALTSIYAIYLIAAFVLFWVAGFDVIYALQDVDYDRSVKLHSIPAALGVKGAIWTSRAFHLIAFIALGLSTGPLGREPRLELLYDIAISLVALLLVTEHAILSIRGKAGLEMAFFTVNGVVSCLLGLAGVLDLVVF